MTDSHTPESRYAKHVKSLYGVTDFTYPTISRDELGRLRQAASAAANPVFLYHSRLDQLRMYLPRAEKDDSLKGGLHSLRDEVSRLAPIAEAARGPALESFKQLSAAIGVESLVEVEFRGSLHLFGMRRVMKTASFILRTSPDYSFDKDYKSLRTSREE